MKTVTLHEAVSFIHNNDTLLIGGSGGGHAVPEALIVALESRYLDESLPNSITLLHPVGIGDNVDQGVSRLAHPGLVKRIITGALVNSPAFQKRAAENSVEAYTLPQGALSQLMRDMAAGRPGLISHVGLHTFIDPRFGGGRQSKSAGEAIVELVELNGQEWIFYKPYHVDVAFLRGTTSDEDGNISMEKEAVFGEMLSMAQATHNCGGLVIVQVERLTQNGSIPAKLVKIPGLLVDLVVVDPHQRQTYLTQYNPAYAGEIRLPEDSITPLPFDLRKIIARRAAMELQPNAICNLGAGVSTGIGTIAAEEGFLNQIILTNEQGLNGGSPSSDAGASVNYTSIVEQPYQFDFYDGGGLDLAFLSFAEVDSAGSVNVSRFVGRIIGVGGFVNISQNAKKVVFSGTLSAGGLKIIIRQGQLRIINEGKKKKFVSQLQQVSYNGTFADQCGQEAMYVTERAVFKRKNGQLELIEIAPGVDIDRDVLSQMEFQPLISNDLKLMDQRLFAEETMGLMNDLKKKEPLNTPERLREDG